MKKGKLIKKVIKNLKETYKNKLLALFMLLAGVLVLILDRDITMLVVAIFCSIPLFSAKDEETF